MSNHLRELILEEIEALKNALALVLVETKKKSANIDAATNDPSRYDALHALYAAENTMAEALLELLDHATGVQVDLRP
jgi:hypothetical protein